MLSLNCYLLLKLIGFPHLMLILDAQISLRHFFFEMKIQKIFLVCLQTGIPRFTLAI